MRVWRTGSPVAAIVSPLYGRCTATRRYRPSLDTVTPSKPLLVTRPPGASTSAGRKISRRIAPVAVHLDEGVARACWRCPRRRARSPRSSSAARWTCRWRCPRGRRAPACRSASPACDRECGRSDHRRGCCRCSTAARCRARHRATSGCAQAGGEARERPPRLVDTAREDRAADRPTDPSARARPRRSRCVPSWSSPSLAVTKRLRDGIVEQAFRRLAGRQELHEARTMPAVETVDRDERAALGADEHELARSVLVDDERFGLDALGIGPAVGIVTELHRRRFELAAVVVEHRARWAHARSSRGRR